MQAVPQKRKVPPENAAAPSFRTAPRVEKRSHLPQSLFRG